MMADFLQIKQINLIFLFKVISLINQQTLFGCTQGMPKLWRLRTEVQSI